MQTDRTTTAEAMSVDPDLLAVVRDILRAKDENALLDRAEHAPGLDRQLWSTLSEAGLTRISTPAEPEHLGGSGAGWLEAAAVLSEAAAAGVDLPLAEHDVLAGRLLADTGLAVDRPSGPRTVALADRHGFAPAVPWAGVDGIGVLAVVRSDEGAVVHDVPAAALTGVSAVPTYAGLPRADVHVGPAPPKQSVRISGSELRTLYLRGALARACSITGALERAVERCVEHTTTRQQFGRPLSRFQAVQGLVTGAAAEAALARTAVDTAVADAVATGLAGPHSAHAVAVARSVAGHATEVVVRNAHQVHGAIGTTAEHGLRLSTLPPLDWRREFGDTLSWDLLLGGAALEESSDPWDLVTGDGPGSWLGPDLDGVIR